MTANWLAELLLVSGVTFKMTSRALWMGLRGDVGDLDTNDLVWGGRVTGVLAGS